MYVSPSVNLVKGRRAHILDKVLAWSLSIGRAVIITTEAIALSAFAYRFFLDQQIITLHDKIKQEQNIVGFLKKSEDTYRNLQSRLQLANSVITTNTKTTQLFNDMFHFIPADMSINTITFFPDQMRIDADVTRISTLSTFVANVKNYPSVTNVSLDKVENKPTTGTIAVTVSITFKNVPTLQ